MTTFKRRLGAFALAALWCTSAATQAAPTLPQVVAGQASFSQQGNVFSITNTPGTIINWQSFGIGAGEITRFIQQSAGSAVLNRVVGQDPTKILGALQSNGKVFLINPNGIVFGQGSRVDVNGLVASSLNLSDADFLAGRKNFQAGSVAGAVRNDGAITTPNGGQVFLIAPDVKNTGVITAPNGDVVLAAGHTVQLVDSGDPDLQVVLAAPADSAVNLGQVIAQGGRIGIYGALVNQRGIVNADSAVVGANGKIVLKASGRTELAAGSVTSAAGSGGADGGTVHVAGSDVAIDGGATIDASGRNGGTVLVGGDYQGGGTLAHAQATTFAAGAAIRADGSAGNGGKVVLWSDGTTTAQGSIAARGTGSGNGGQVETSGHVLDVDGIQVSAAGGARGKNGSWLLDPYDIEVVDGGSATTGDVATPGAGDTEGTSRVAPATLTASGTDIVLQAQHDITVTDALNAAGNVSATAGHDITVNAQVSSSGGDLDFRAGSAFVLGANGALKTGNDIDIQANHVELYGAIGPLGAGQKPVLTFTSADADRPISIGTGFGDSDGPRLQLDAATLASLSNTLYEINIGNSLHTGSVSVDAALSAASNLVLENAGDIHVNAAVDLSAAAGTRFIASLYGVDNTIYVAAPIKASTSILLQGDQLRIGATVTAPDVTLMPNDDIQIRVGEDGLGDGFFLDQAALALVNATNLTIGGLAGATAGLVVNGDVVLAGGTAPAKLTLDAGGGDLTIQTTLSTASTLALTAGGNVATGANGSVDAAALAVRAGGNVALNGNTIGTLAGSGGGAMFEVDTGAALRVGSVDGLSGVSAPGATLQFSSAGSLTLDAGVSGGAYAVLTAAGIGGSGVLQADALSLRSSAGIGSAATPLATRTGRLVAVNSADGGTQPINIANQGTLVLQQAVQDGSDNAGAISIDNVGGLTVPAYTDGQGEVRTGSGNISLATHSPLIINGHVVTDSGNVTLLADNGGALTINSGAEVASGSGTISITGGTTSIASGTVSVSDPSKLTVTNTNAGTGPGSGGDTPPTLDACIANPALAGCSAVLPPIGQCISAPTTKGCSVVLPPIDQCIKTPGALGCSVVLPPIDQCIKTPGALGCSVVLPPIDQCIKTPSALGCSVVLPPIDQCIKTPNALGCSVVLPPIDQCIKAPGALGCSVVLPPIDQCIKTPGALGCSVVLPPIDQCIKTPSALGCSVVLPTLTQCTNTPALPGCGVVLPTLDQCTDSPTLQGCGVVLPPLTTCAAVPSTPGCTAVIPNAGFCSTHPADASCVPFTGGAGGGADTAGLPVSQAQQTTVQLINASMPNVAAAPTGQQTDASDAGGAGGGGERAAGPAQAQQTGATNDKAVVKNYCN